MVFTSIVFAIAITFSAVHSANAFNGARPSEVEDKNKQTAGSSLFQATATSVKGTMSRTRVADPFEDLEDDFAAVPSSVTKGMSIKRVPDPFEEYPEESFATAPSELAPSTSASGLLISSSFWRRCVQDVVTFGCLSMLLPLVACAFFEVRKRAAKRVTQAHTTNEGSQNPPQHSKACLNLLPLMEAARLRDGSRWRQLLTIANANAADRFGSTPLHVAANAPCAEMGGVLILEYGVDVNAKDTWDETPLHFGARAGSVDVCELLVANGADVNAKNSDGMTPLLAAAMAGKEATCQLLLDRGASCGDVSDSDLPPVLVSLLLDKMTSPHPSVGTADKVADEGA
jgi:hypothetical protein